MRVSLAFAASVAVLSLAACAGGGTPSATPSSSGPEPSSSASPSVSPVVSPTPTHVYVFGDEWILAPESEAQGSGCAPGTGLLPDGAWFGFAKAWSTTEISFDLACWWSGAEAEAQAAANGDEAFDYYITNDNTTVRLVTIAPTAEAKKANPDAGIFSVAEVIADPEGGLPTGAPYPVWIYVNGGVVTQIAVQYVP